METSYEYGGGWLIRCNWDRISGSGVENMHLDTEFNESEKDSNGRWCDEDHAWSAVIIRAAEHCWVRNVTSSHFAFATVHHATGSKNITVENCHGYMPVSEITGSRRYAFQFSGAQLCIVKDCSCEHDRHAFATSHARTTGPNVYLRCTATDMFGDIGPHVGWSSGVLAFMIEQIMGLAVDWNGAFRIEPQAASLETIEAKLPFQDGWLNIHIAGDTATVEKV